MTKTFKPGDVVTWKKTEGSKAQDWTGTVLKVYEDGVAVEWIGSRKGTMKVQSHFGEQAANVIASK